jgi:hypothetical protein
VAAVLVLVIGSLMRPDSKQASVVPTNELASLPERSQRRVLRDMAEYIRERAATFALSVVYLPSIGVNGLVLAQDSIVSAFTPASGSNSEGTSAISPSFLVMQMGSLDSANPAGRDTSLTVLTPRWGVVVARAPDGTPLALAGMTGGAVGLQCGAFALREIVFDAVIPPSFSGGAVFDLEGNVFGQAIPCAGRTALVPLEDVVLALGTQATPEHQLWARYGFRVAPLNSITPGVLRADSGLVVMEVLLSSAAHRAGLRPGDVLSGNADTGRARIDHLLAAPGGSELKVTRLRNGTVDLGMGRPEGGAIVTSQERGMPPVITLEVLDSRAEQAGLRAGDRVIQIGSAQRPSLEAVRRALADSSSVFLVYERNGFQRGVLLQ